MTKICCSLCFKLVTRPVNELKACWKTAFYRHAQSSQKFHSTGKKISKNCNSTVSCEQEVGGIRSSQPLQRIDLLFNLQTLEVVKLRLMRLERTVDLELFALCISQTLHVNEPNITNRATANNYRTNLSKLPLKSYGGEVLH